MLRRFLSSAFVLALVGGLWPALATAGPREKIDQALTERANRAGWSRVIVTLVPGADVSTDVLKLGGRLGRRLELINGQVIELPNGQLKKLAAHPAVERLDHDRPTVGLIAQVANIVGARMVQHTYGYDGAGVGVAVVDSGITNWHDDLTYSGSNAAVQVRNNQRVAAFVDFVNGATQPYDDHGHGTHVSGIIAGNGYDSRGIRSGLAPAAHLVSLKVLDAQGRGVISNVIAAIEYAVTNKDALKIRVINLSVGAPVTTSYNSDPLTIAAKRAVEAGIVVVAAAGNLGRNAAGQIQNGAIAAPGNAPWVLTVGASNHQGTMNRKDDTVAPYSSRGPAAVDFAAKPDIVAPGTGVVSLSSKGSTLYLTKATYLLSGQLATSYKPYLALTGTSMAAPVVSGTVALMMQANPNLTPNLVKAMLQYTAQVQPGVDFMAQGGGFLNAKGAVDLARYFQSAQPGARYPSEKAWARKFNWGNRRLGGGAISPFGTAWETGTVWGAAFDRDGDNVVWGTECATETCKDAVWGTALFEGDNVVWGTALFAGDNVVWGTASAEGDNVVWGTISIGDNVVWGTIAGGDNVVWGTDCGGVDCYNVIWGVAAEGDNMVWGTADNADAVAWGSSGTVPSTIWATSGTDGDAVVWDPAMEELIVIDPNAWLQLFEPAPTEEVVVTPALTDNRLLF